MRKTLLSLIATLVLISVTCIGCGGNSGENQDIYISNVEDYSNTSKNTNTVTSTEGTEVYETEDTIETSEATEVHSIYEELTVEDSLLGGWSTSSGEVYDFGNGNVLIKYNSESETSSEYTYETDGTTYVTITDSNGTPLTYQLTLSTELNSFGDEVDVAVLVKGDVSIVLNKQYSIKKLSKDVLEQY